MKSFKLGDICTDIAYGYTESANWENIGPKFLRITDIQNYFVDWNNVPHCPITKENHEKYKLELGDIVIARTGATTGVTSIFKDAEIDAVFASYLIRYKINKDLANPFYVGYILRSPFWKSYVDSIIGGSAQPGANAKQFANFDLLLPTRAIQNSIADILISIDERIELNIKMNQTLEVTAQSIYRKWFFDFENPYVKGEFVNGMPLGWQVGKISDIYKTTSGGTPSRSTDEYFQNGTIKWVKSKELNGSFLFDTEEKITAEAIKNSSARILPRHSLLIAMYGATVGEYAIIGSEAACNQAICAILPNNDYPFTYILEYLKINKDNIVGQASGSAQQNISQALIQRQEILIPPSQIVKAFHEVVGHIYNKVENNILANLNLIDIRNAILPYILSGKIDVKE